MAVMLVLCMISSSTALECDNIAFCAVEVTFAYFVTPFKQIAEMYNNLLH